MKTKKIFTGFLLVIITIFLQTGCQTLLTKALTDHQVTKWEAEREKENSRTYTKNNFLQHHGKPDKVILIDKESEAEVWEYHNVPTKGKVKAFAFIGNEAKRYTTRDMTEYSEDYLKRGYATFLSCYDYLQPAQGDSIAKIRNIMGPPEDEFPLKDEQGQPVPNSTIIWYFDTDNGQLTRTLMISLRNNIATKVEEWTGPQATSAYGSYVVLCERMAHRPPKFALR